MPKECLTLVSCVHILRRVCYGKGFSGCTLPGFGIPHLDGSVHTSCENAATFFDKGVHTLVVSSKRSFALPRPCIPHLDAFIRAATEHLVVHSKQINYSRFVRIQRCFTLIRAAVPYLNRAVCSAAHNFVVYDNYAVDIVMGAYQP